MLVVGILFVFWLFVGFDCLGVVGGFPLVVACFSCLVDVFVWVVALVLVGI